MAAGIGACPLSPPADIPDARTAHTTTIGTCTDHGAAEWQATMEALILVATFGWGSRRRRLGKERPFPHSSSESWQARRWCGPARLRAPGCSRTPSILRPSHFLPGLIAPTEGLQERR